MRIILGLTSILFALFGLVCGVVDWTLSNFVLDSVDWEGPLVPLQMATWILTPVSYGLAIMLAAGAAISGRNS